MARCRRLDEVFDGIGASVVALREFPVHRAAIAVWVRGKVDAADRRRRRAPHRKARYAHAEFRAAVKALAQGDDFAVATVDFGEQQCPFGGLRARGAEEGFLQVARRYCGEFFGEVDEVFGQVDVADVLEFIDLFFDFRGDFGIAVAAVHDGYASVHVEILFAVAVPEVLHRAFDHLLRIRVEVGQAWHDVFLFLFDDGLRANVVLFFHFLYPFRIHPSAHHYRRVLL